jgi:outer membrane protein assembly factor BamE (lipoprotein component of BamABCDE complex)
MHIDIKKKKIEEKMLSLSFNKRDKFREFLVNSFSDDDLKDLSHTNADKLLTFLASI